MGVPDEVSGIEPYVSYFNGVKFVTRVQVFMKASLGGRVPGWPHEYLGSSKVAQNGQNGKN